MARFCWTWRLSSSVRHWRAALPFSARNAAGSVCQEKSWKRQKKIPLNKVTRLKSYLFSRDRDDQHLCDCSKKQKENVPIEILTLYEKADPCWLIKRSLFFYPFTAYINTVLLHILAWWGVQRGSEDPAMYSYMSTNMQDWIIYLLYEASGIYKSLVSIPFETQQMQTGQIVHLWPYINFAPKK